MINEGTISNLIKRKDDIDDINNMRKEAQKLAHEKGLVLPASLTLTRACKTSPRCRHCIWRAYGGTLEESIPTSVEELVLRALRIQQSGLDQLTLISGWMGNALPAYFFNYIEAIKENTHLAINATFGAISMPDMIRLKEIGVDRITCGLEATNPRIFRNLMPGSDYEARVKTLQNAKELGFKTRTHLIIGIGESVEDIDSSIRIIDQLGVDFLSIASLQPAPFTETEMWDRPRPYWVSMVVAAARIALPRLDISSYFCGEKHLDAIWGMKSGSNAFAIDQKNPDDPLEVLRDGINRLNVMWNNYPITQSAPC
jgi:biotin synthase-like enzyme